ncbi:acyl-CoA N-acyltransferase, partial [Fimicolochytrium jonesii]|uniref:acyl-CoA N-acyltransferase n=1 Tax=Fimicolochytrium jonesii TaxID=1396493 RepID=UPI0022FE5E64
LTPLTAADLPYLYDLSHPLPTATSSSIYTYLPYGPFASLAEYTAFATETYLEPPTRDGSLAAFVIRLAGGSSENGAEPEPIGLIAYLNVVPLHRRVEIGHIWTAPIDRLRGKGYGAEAAFLLMQNAFDVKAEDGGRAPWYRVEWKTHHENVASQKTASRLGFTKEGVFRYHMWYGEEPRHTLYYAIARDEW